MRGAEEDSYKGTRVVFFHFMIKSFFVSDCHIQTAVTYIEVRGCHMTKVSKRLTFLKSFVVCES